MRNPGWGKLYGTPQGFYLTTDGRRVRMWRKRCRVRWYNAQGLQVGPEHSNVGPALVWAHAQGWRDPRSPRWLQLGLIREARGSV